MSPEEVAASRRALDTKAPMLGFRFAGDRLCSEEKFTCIRLAFNDERRERVQLKTLPGDGHSVFTLDFVDEDGHPTRTALAEMLDYFNATLRPTA
jgi:hypothetical protein